MITNFYQIGPASYRSQVLIELLIVIAQEPLFDILRNKEQLGYDISCLVNDNYGILGYSITVNSQETKYSSEYVEQRIENFRRTLISFIESMPDEDFNATKISLAKMKLNEDTKLSEEVHRNWNEITIDEYEFDRQYKEVEHLIKITKADLLEFYRMHYGENERKLSIQVIGNKIAANIENENENEIDVVFSPNDGTDIETQRKRFDALSFVDFEQSINNNLIKDLVAFKNTLEIHPLTRTNDRFV